eukprot:5634036-Prymnesium_polylepis.1
MQAEKTIELEGFEGKLERGAMALVFKEFARVAKKEANATRCSRTRSSWRLRSPSPLQGLGQGGSRAHDHGAHGGDRGVELPAAADVLRLELAAIKAAKAGAKGDTANNPFQA